MAGSVYWFWSATTLQVDLRIRFMAPVMSGMSDCITSDKCRMSDPQCERRVTTSPMALFDGVQCRRCTIAQSSMVAFSILLRAWIGVYALTEAKIKDYSRHCNRHTFASRLVMAGVDLRTVAELMGHSSIQMTMTLCAPCTAAQSRRRGPARVCFRASPDQKSCETRK